MMKSRPEPTTIRAEAPPEPSAFRIRAEGSVAIEAARGQGKRPTFAIVGYTGAVMSIEGFFSPVIVDLTGLRAAGPQIPALRGHDTDRIVGQTDAIAIDQDVQLTGTITGDNADAQEVVSQAANGFKWQASIGATILLREFLEPGKTTTVNGREVTGPLVIAREALLQEISFVAIGADSATSADVAASHPPGHPTGSHQMQFDDWLKAKGFPDPAALSDAQRTSLRAMFDKEQAATTAVATTATAGSNGTVAANGATTGTAASTTPAPDPATVRSLDDIFADQRRENARVEEITRITAQSMRERPGMIDTLERMSRTAIEARVAPAAYELEMLRAMRAALPIGMTIHSPHHVADTRATQGTIEAAICAAGGLPDLEKHFDARTLQLSRDRFRDGIGLVQTLEIGARENGYTGHGARNLEALLRAGFPTTIRAEGFSTLSLPGILSNVANKFLSAGFNAVESSWRDIAARRPVNDFKTVTTYALTGGFVFEKVGPSGELKHATAGELSYQNAAETYGKIFAITRRDIVNDDLGALTAVPKKMGRGAAQKLNDVFWSVFMNNSAFFTSGNANLITGGGSALSLNALTTLSTTFANQTDPDGFPLGITPKILLVPNALSVLANNLMTSTMLANDTTANTSTLANNPFAGRYRVSQSSYLSNANYTGFSTTAWYLLADPADLAVIEVAFLNGRETPIVESADAEFDVLGIQFRGFFDLGVAMQEFRAGAKSAGA